MKDEEIEVTIDPDGKVHLEGFNFEGQACHEALEKLRKKLGETTKTTKKQEYYRHKVKVSTRQRN